MSGQAANKTREQVRSDIKRVEKNLSGSSNGGLKKRPLGSKKSQ